VCDIKVSSLARRAGTSKVQARVDGA